MSLAVAIEPAIGPVPPDLPDPFYEVVDGRVVENAPMAAKSGWIASRLFGRLLTHAEPHGLGMVLVEVLFILDANRRLQRRPDLAFISAARWPIDQDIPEEEGWDVVPNLAIEINSPSNMLAEVLAKVREYFEAGVEQVWLVVPSERLIYVYDSPSRVHVLTHEDELDGGAIVPGFRTPVADLFPRVAPGPA